MVNYSNNKISTPFTSHMFFFIIFTFLKMPLASATCSMGPTICTTPLLSFLILLQSEALHSLGPTNFDPKLYVDLPLTYNLSFVKTKFERLPRDYDGRVPVNALNNFLKECFGEAGSDLVGHDPNDFKPDPKGFLGNVKNKEVRKWALDVHGLWKNLSRRVSDAVLDDPDSHTLLPLVEPVVIPGSRFREVYYWDTYWIIRGLLVSNMPETAKAMVRNLISMIDVYGFVLNGARAYYTNRSQPPLLSAMVMEIYSKTNDLSFVNKSLPSLLKEHSFWNSGFHNVVIKDLKGKKHSLSRFYAKWDKPRPESATIDEESASNLSSITERKRFFRNVASTAESGWDFSSRWMRNSSDFTTLSTTSIIPVDLNVYTYKAAKARLRAIKTIFWSNETEQWHDYWLNSTQSCKKVHHFDVRNQNHKIYISNFIPLWIPEIYSDDALVETVVRSFKKSGLLYPAGIAASLINTSQQLDFPNGWPHLQHMIVEGLVKSNNLEAKALAEDIAIRWLRTNYVTFQKTGAMQEKYDVEVCGKAGGGGEYKIQTGFGWSNGVVLAFLDEFGWPEDRSIDCQPSQ